MRAPPPRPLPRAARSAGRVPARRALGWPGTARHGVRGPKEATASREHGAGARGRRHGGERGRRELGGEEGAGRTGGASVGKGRLRERLRERLRDHPVPSHRTQPRPGRPSPGAVQPARSGSAERRRRERGRGRYPAAPHPSRSPLSPCRDGGALLHGHLESRRCPGLAGGREKFGRRWRRAQEAVRGRGAELRLGRSW